MYCLVDQYCFVLLLLRVFSNVSSGVVGADVVLVIVVVVVVVVIFAVDAAGTEVADCV